MLGWFFSGHPIVDVSNSLSPLLRRPHQVRRPWGFGYPPLGSRACTFGTSQSQRRRLPLLDPGGSWRDLPRPRRACSYLWKLAHHPGEEWMPFDFAWGLRPFRSGWRWLAICPGLEWVLVGPHWGRANSCPAAGQRLPWMESQLEAGPTGVAYH